MYEQNTNKERGGGEITLAIKWKMYWRTLIADWWQPKKIEREPKKKEKIQNGNIRKWPIIYIARGDIYFP